MIRAVRHFFLTRALREKLLLVAFVAIGVLWWFSAFSKRANTFWLEQRSTTSRLAEQAQWIKNRPMIEKTAQKTAERLDPARTLNGNQLVTTVAQLASAAGLKNAVGGAQTTEKHGQFALHTAEFTISRSEWELLKKFDESLQQRSPYLSIEKFALGASANGAELTLSLKVVSFEITP